MRSWTPVAAILLGTGWGANQFAPMLLVYEQALGLGTATTEAMFGVYALALIPGLLLAGPLSDARGRRVVVVPAAVLSLAGSVVLVVGADSLALLFVGRFLAGVSSGAVFGAATAWMRELSCRPRGSASPETAARRAAISMTVGFGAGPLVAGLLAQWAPAPRVVPYLPHIALMAVVLILLRGAPETVEGDVDVDLDTRSALSGTGGIKIAGRRFWQVVAPMAPWVFAAPAIAFALLPTVVGADHAADGIAVTAAITALTAFAGVLVQPLARRLDARSRRNRAAIAGLLTLVAGLLLGSLTASSGQAWLLVPCAVVLGCAYGLCLVAGLIEVGRLAGPDGLAGLTAAYYALAYLGFAAPVLLALAAHLAGYPLLLLITAALALGTATTVVRAPAQRPERVA